MNPSTMIEYNEQQNQLQDEINKEAARLTALSTALAISKQEIALQKERLKAEYRQAIASLDQTLLTRKSDYVEALNRLQLLKEQKRSMPLPPFPRPPDPSDPATPKAPLKQIDFKEMEEATAWMWADLPPEERPSFSGG